MKIKFGIVVFFITVLVIVVILVASRLSTPPSQNEESPPIQVIPVEPGCDRLAMTLYTPSSNDFFNMHFQSNRDAPYAVTSQNWINARIVDLVFPISPKLNDSMYPVFGYDDSSQLVLAGGKRYNDHLTEVNFRLHLVKEEDQRQINENNLSVSMGASAKFFTERGFQIASADFNSSDNFTFTNSFNQITPTESKSSEIYIKAIFNSNNELAFIDFCCFSGVGGLGGYTDYRADLDQPNFGDNRDDRFSYPIRIPVSKTCIEFENVLGTRPAVYYRSDNGQLSIDVPEGTDHIFHYNPSFDVFAPGIFAVEVKGIMNAFSGVFGTFRRTQVGGNSTIVKTGSFFNTDYLAQVSDVIRVKSELQDEGLFSPSGGVKDIEFTVRSQDPNRSPPNSATTYAGMIVPKQGAGSRAFDIIVLNPSILNGFSQGINAYTYKGETIDGVYFNPGDNVNTHVVEVAGAPNNFTVFDDDDWSRAFIQMPAGTLSNPATPENINMVGPPLPADQNNLLIGLNTHEYVHAIHQSQGIVFALSTEGIATGIEMLSELNNELFSSFRPRSFASYMTGLSRGYWSFGEIGNAFTDTSTYGSSMMYHHMIKKYDKNLQALRRSGDLISSIYQASAVDLGVTNYFEFFVNNYGGAERMSMQTAYNEILSRDFIDDYCDTMIAMCVLRNNSSIPEKYQAEYPYWLSSSAYPYNNETAYRYNLNVTDASFVQPSVGGVVTVNITGEVVIDGKTYIKAGNQRYGIYDLTFVERIDDNTAIVELELLSVLDGQSPGSVVPAVSQLIFRDFTEWWDVQQNNDTYWNSDIQHYFGPPLPEFHTIIPSLAVETVDRDVEDLATLMYDIDPAVTSITITADASSFKVAMIQFTPDGGAGDFQQLPSVGNLTDLQEGDFVTYSTASLTGAGRKRLVITHSNITDWENELPFGPASNLVANYAVLATIIPTTSVGSVNIVASGV
jgi:hypothetical protein